MRRDVYIENDSGGFSVVAADAVDAIIEDRREDDFKFVQSRKAMLIELYGDDSMPIRIVVDEPLTREEADQWVARYSWEIETSDGKMIAMGGFDPDVLAWWKESGESDHTDGRGIGTFTAAPGRWRVDVYAHCGSMNGRAILSDEAPDKPGVAYRRSHGDRPFPLWLAKMLEFSGEDDPGHEELWNDVKASMEAGALEIDVESGDAIGFLIHVTKPTTAIGDPPESIWIGRSENARQPRAFPLGLKSEVPDPELRRFYDKLLDIKHPEPPRPPAEDFIEIIASWPGETLKKIEGGPVAVGLDELYLLHWMAGLTSDVTPRFELWVEAKGAWSPPAATPDFALKTNGSMTAIGPVSNTGGWHTWWTSRLVAQALGAVPDGSTLTLACLPDQKERVDPNSRAGIALYEATVSGGKCMLSEASPKVAAKTLQDALTFMRELLNNRMHVSGELRETFEETAQMNFVREGGIQWNGDIASLADPDDRTHLLLAPVLFKPRFGDTWPCDPPEELDEED